MSITPQGLPAITASQPTILTSPQKLRAILPSLASYSQRGAREDLLLVSDGPQEFRGHGLGPLEWQA